MRKVVIAVLIYLSVGLFMALVVRNVQLPDEQAGMNASYGPFNAFLQETSGKPVNTDFEVDIVSAKALWHGEDPYGVTADLLDRFEMPAWQVELANPHPPTTIVIAMPFALLSYQDALTAWTLLMIFALIFTIRLMGVRLAYAAPLGVAISILFPGAYGLGNPVLVIGLGVAMAYRYRDHPIIAAAGLTLAAAPKASGLLLLIPFVMTLRWKAAAWTVAFMALLALVPFAFYPAAWSNYLKVGVESIALNAARDDNAAVLNLATKIGVPTWLAAAALVAVAVSIGWVIKDTYWPAVWLLVALLPIAWMYSLLTLIPLFCATVRRPNPWGVGAIVLATALTIGSPPLGMWPTRVLPLIVLLAAVALTQVNETEFWPSRTDIDRVLRRGHRPVGRSRADPGPTPGSPPASGLIPSDSGVSSPD